MRRILIIDDTATVLMSERLLLSAHGFEIATAYNGKDALGILKQFKPDLILCDVIMPIMGGVEFLEKLKQDSTNNKIPVIMVTTQGQNKKMEECFEAGCDDYITKPIDKQQLLAKVRRHLPLKRPTPSLRH